MAGDFFPRRDAELRNWATNLAAKLLAAPHEYHITPERAASFAQLQAHFEQACRRAIDPATATRSAVGAKRNAKAAMIAAARKINGLVKAGLGSNAEAAGRIILLGLNPRNRGGRVTLLPGPESAPQIAIEAVVSRTLHVQLRAAQSVRPGRPRGVKGVNVYCFIGPEPPQSISHWTWVMETIKTRFAIDFPSHLPPGAQVWISMQWKNRRGQTGPASAPIPLNLPGGTLGATMPRTVQKAA